MKRLAILLLLSLIFIGGCTELTNITDSLRTTPYIKSVDCNPSNRGITTNLLIINPTSQDYSPAKLDLSITGNLIPTSGGFSSSINRVDVGLIKAKDQKNYSIDFTSNNAFVDNSANITFRIYNYQDYLFDKYIISIPSIKEGYCIKES